MSDFSRPSDSDATPGEGVPLLAEDVLLLLFQPDSGTIAGEGTLYYVLGGAVLTDLALTGQVTVEDAGMRGTLARTTGETPPADPILRPAWEYMAEKPRNVQAVIASAGPPLRGPVLDRLIERGDLRSEERKTLGIFKTQALKEGSTGRRAELLARVRATLIDGAEPTPRVAATAALLSASGELVAFHKDIPWTTSMVSRAKELEQGDWGAGAAAEAVTRTMTAIIISSMVTANVLPRR